MEADSREDLQMKRAVFSEDDTIGVIHDEITQVRVPLNATAETMLKKMLDKQDAVDSSGSFKFVPDGFCKFTEKFSPWKIGEELAVMQSYYDIWRSNQNETSLLAMRKERGWRQRHFAIAEKMPHRIVVKRITLSRANETSDENAVKCGAKECRDHITGELLGWMCDPREPNAYKTPHEAFAAKWRSLGLGDCWCWCYDIELKR